MLIFLPTSLPTSLLTSLLNSLSTSHRTHPFDHSLSETDLTAHRKKFDSAFEYAKTLDIIRPGASTSTHWFHSPTPTHRYPHSLALSSCCAMTWTLTYLTLTYPHSPHRYPHSLDRRSPVLVLCNGMDAVGGFAFDHYHGWKSGMQYNPSTPST